MILGYKCFNKNLINNYNKTYEIGKKYEVSGEVKFGNNGNGFHFCKNLEDTLRYFDSFNEDIDICKVIGSGDIKQYDDEYYGYYDMYVSSVIVILKKLTRKEIFDIIFNSSEFSVVRFISGYKLTDSELEMFEKKYMNNQTILDAITYYYKDKNVYQKKYGLKR